MQIKDQNQLEEKDPQLNQCANPLAPGFIIDQSHLDRVELYRPEDIGRFFMRVASYLTR